MKKFKARQSVVHKLTGERCTIGYKVKCMGDIPSGYYPVTFGKNDRILIHETNLISMNDYLGTVEITK